MKTSIFYKAIVVFFFLTNAVYGYSITFDTTSVDISPIGSLKFGEQSFADDCETQDELINKIQNQEMLIFELGYLTNKGTVYMSDSKIEFNPKLNLQVSNYKETTIQEDINEFSPNYQDFMYADRDENCVNVRFVLFSSNGSSFLKFMKNSLYLAVKIEDFLSKKVG